MSMFQVDLYVNGVDNTPRPLIVNKDWTIDQLIREISAKFKNGVDPSRLHLVCAGKPLVFGSGKSIKDHDFIVHGARIDLIQQVSGGSSKLQPLAGYIELTSEPCCVSFDDDANTSRAKMPCHCAISVEEMKRMCDTVLADGGYQFRCPGCCVEWAYFLVRHVLSACMNHDQLTELGKKININYFRRQPDIQKCPMCSTYSQRDLDLSRRRHIRVVCPTCTKTGGHGDVEFCWSCLKEWKASGHEDCDGSKSKVRYLATCDTKKIGLVDGCPAVRGCPKCGQLLWHKEACKHMKCPKPCDYNFCFVCLKPQNNEGQWQCGAHNAVCQVAPRQTVLPN